MDIIAKTRQQNFAFAFERDFFPEMKDELHNTIFPACSRTHICPSLSSASSRTAMVFVVLDMARRVRGSCEKRCRGRVKRMLRMANIH
jgi:hypothetical protein